MGEGKKGEKIELTRTGVGPDNARMAGLLEEVRVFFARELAGLRSLGLAVSGGLDSVVLLDLAASTVPAGIELVVLHFDHALRPDSAAVARFVSDLAAARGFMFYAERWEREGAARLESRTVSPVAISEDEARKARYRFLARAATACGLDAIAVAHTADDQAETVLARLLRGTGRCGLCGMSPVVRRDGYRLLRPLLGVRRGALERHALNAGLTWHEDPTNRSLVYTRNRIRHRVLPFLSEHASGDLVEALCRTAAILREDEDFLGDLAAREMALWGGGSGDRRRRLDAVSALPPALAARVFRGLLEEAGAPVTRESVSALRSVAATGSRVDLAGGISARVETERGDAWLVIGRRSEPIAAVREVFVLSVPGTTMIPPLGLTVRVTRAERSPGLAVLAAGTGGRPRRDGPWRARAWLGGLEPADPLVVRTRRDGDRLTPLGMSGSRKLQDLFTDEKIPLVDRDRWPLVCSGNRILWVVGLRQDESTRVRPDASVVTCVDVEAAGGREDPGLVA